MARANKTSIFLVGIVATILLGWVLHVGAGILQPFVIALLLASMLQPVVRFLARVGIPPVLTVLMLVVLLFLGLARLGILIQTQLEAFLFGRSGPAAIAQVERPAPPTVAPHEMETGEGTGDGAAADPDEVEGAAEEKARDADEGEGARDAQAQATGEPEQATEEPQDEAPPVREVSAWDALGLEEQEKRSKEAGGWDVLVERIADHVRSSSLPPGIVDYVVRSLKEIQPERLAPGLVGSSLSFTKGLLLVLLYMLFIFAEQAVFRRKILSIAGARRNDAAEVLDTIGRGIQRYLGVKTIVSLATGSICYAALVILKVPYAPLFGFLTFVLNYIPTFGSIIAGSFPTMYVLAFDQAWGKAFIIAAVYLSVNITLGSIVEPRILGRELNLSPLVVVLSVVVWAGLWGVVGSFLAVPLTSILQIVLASQETTRPIAVMLSSGKGLESEPPPQPSPLARAGPPPAERREKRA